MRQDGHPTVVLALNAPSSLYGCALFSVEERATFEQLTSDCDAWLSRETPVAPSVRRVTGKAARKG